jgi:hypothetical protein
LRRIVVALVAVLLSLAIIGSIMKVNDINAEYDRNIREHPPTAPVPLMH